MVNAESDREARIGHQDKKEKRHYCRLLLGRSWEFAVKGPTRLTSWQCWSLAAIRTLAEGTAQPVVSLETSWW